MSLTISTDILAVGLEKIMSLLARHKIHLDAVCFLVLLQYYSSQPRLFILSPKITRYE